MLWDRLPSELAGQCSVRLNYDRMQDVACIEITCENVQSQDSGVDRVPGMLYFIIDLPAIRLFMRSDSEILMLWLNLLNLDGVFLTFTKNELHDLTDISERLADLGLRERGLVLGMPATGRDGLMVHFQQCPMPN